MKTKDELTQTLGDLLREQLEVNELTQVKAAEIIGTHQQSISAVVTGRNVTTAKVSPFMLIRWLERLGVDASIKVEVAK